MCPVWLPRVDIGRRFARITLKAMRARGFDHEAHRACRSSKRVQTGEPSEIDVSILYFTGDPNSTLKLIV